MRAIRSRAVIAVLVLAAFVRGSPGEARRRWRLETAPEGLVEGTLEHGGRTRSYFLDFGAGEAETKRPLVVVLHGGQGSARRIAAYARFGDLARREGFVVAYPEAVGRNWNDGRDLERYTSHREGVDDVGFLETLIDHLIDEHGLDADRVYVTGPSNGGMMTYRLVLEKPRKVAAAAAVIANLPARLAGVYAAATDAPVPLLIVNGSADPLMPHLGGEITFGIWGGLGRVLSTRGTADFFADRGGCGGEPRRSPVTDADPMDGIDVERLSFGAPGARCAVELYVLVGGGHTWPGAPQYAPKSLVGPATESLDAGELIWSFFSRRSR